MLPEDLIIYVYKFLSPYALRQLSCSSRLFYQLAWHEICCRYKRLVNSNLSILPALLDRQSYWYLVGQTCYECTVRSTYLIPHPLEPWLLCDVCISKLATDRVLLTLSQVETLYGLVSDGLVADIHSGRMRRCDLAYKKSPSRHSVCNFSMAAVLTSDTSESSDSDTSESSSESDFSNGHSRFFQNPPVKLPMYSIAAQSSVNSDLESRNNSFTLVFYYQHIEQRAREVYGTSDTNKLASRSERDLTRKRQIFLEMEQKKRHKFMYSILNTWQSNPLITWSYYGQEKY
ncbi:hypothetical protein BDF19DRAFT_420319 [Syncephalis fuscata]|nr:hypothetical protein BDF19DRAFT_420319 [Syncephalis fuscata]